MEGGMKQGRRGNWEERREVRKGEKRKRDWKERRGRNEEMKCKMEAGKDWMI